MAYTPLVTAVVINWNGRDVVGSCVDSILHSNYPEVEVIVVDNVSSDGSIELLTEMSAANPRVKLIVSEKQIPIEAAFNTGMKSARGEFIFLLTNDIQLDRNCIKELMLHARDNAGVFSPKILDPSGKIDFIGGLMDKLGYGYGRGYGQDDNQQYNNQDFFYAGLFLFKKRMLEKTGYFDEDVCFAWGDVDLSWRMRLAGYKIILVPGAITYHLGSHTLKKLRTKYFCSFNTRKNRLAGLIKNYGFFNLLRFLPQLLLFYFLISLKELMLDRDPCMAFSSVHAVYWNIRKLPLLLKKRRFIQKYVRSVPDKEIMRYMAKKPILIEYFLMSSFKSCLRRDK